MSQRHPERERDDLVLRLDVDWEENELRSLAESWKGKKHSRLINNHIGLLNKPQNTRKKKQKILHSSLPVFAFLRSAYLRSVLYCSAAWNKCMFGWVEENATPDVWFNYSSAFRKFLIGNRTSSTPSGKIGRWVTYHTYVDTHSVPYYIVSAHIHSSI